MRITDCFGRWMLMAFAAVLGCGTNDSTVPGPEDSDAAVASQDAGAAATEVSLGGSGPSTTAGGLGGVAPGTGSTPNVSGGAAGTGGVRASGGSGAGDGGTVVEGTSGTAGSQAAGSTLATGGASATGGVTSTGGGLATGGMPATGGAAGSGEPATGGQGPNASAACKRGIAANIPPGAAFVPAVAWWYNWAINDGGKTAAGMQFVPMIWGSATAGDSIAASSKYLLGFNEPNFVAQADLSAQDAARLWPAVEASAATAGASVVGPGMNFCGPTAQCHGTDPYQYYKDFFAACSDCEVDHIAVHWYNCDLPSLIDYLEPGGNLEGFEQFNKPIWITEFSCDGQASAVDQERYMREAVAYLESNPKVFRYSWFSADPIPNARLIASDGSPTALGQVYISLDQNCP